MFKGSNSIGVGYIFLDSYSMCHFNIWFKGYVHITGWSGPNPTFLPPCDSDLIFSITNQDNLYKESQIWFISALWICDHCQNTQIGMDFLTSQEQFMQAQSFHGCSRSDCRINVVFVGILVHMWLTFQLNLHMHGRLGPQRYSHPNNTVTCEQWMNVNH